MTWPNKISSTLVKVELEKVYEQIENLAGMSAESLDKIKTDLKVHFSNIDKNKNRALSSKVRQHINNLQNLRKDNSVYISRFDKGNGVCLDVKERYIHKMNQILSDRSKFNEYKMDKRVKLDPFIYAEERFNRQIKELFKKNNLPTNILSNITSSGSMPARLYGLPKIHKNDKDPPYRPVLSMVNAYPSRLAKYLDKILKPFIPTSRTCKDTFDFKEKLLCATLPKDSYMVSFDVVSLFTNVPVNETIDYILNIIPRDQLPLPKNVLKTLLQLACSNILFSFQNKLFTQIDGMCMGSNLGPTMSAFALDMLESKFNNQPIFYQRYVDDIFAIFTSRADAEQFLIHINSFHPNLKFTIEHPQNDQLVFLDTSIQLINGKVSTSWHIKKTNTGVYLPKIASSPTHYKTAAIRALIYRAYRLSSSIENFHKSYKVITSIFINNGFHFKFIEKIKNIVLNKLSTAKTKDENETIIYYKTPFIKEIEKSNKSTFHRINSLLHDKARIRIAYQTRKTANFFPNKDKMPDSLRSNVVYQFNCGHCGGCYTGETVRHFYTRTNEHLSGRPNPSEVSLHVHPPTAADFKIVLKTTHTKIGEALIDKFVDRLNNNQPPFTLKLF